MKMKLAFGLVILFMSAVFQPVTAQAAEGDITVATLKNTSCDQRAPLIKVTLAKEAQRVGYGAPASDTIYWLDTNGVDAGTHRYSLPEQPFGSMREWVLVAAFEGEQELSTAPMLTFTRPERSSCVVTRNLRITKYSGDVNQRCPKDTQKYFIVKAFVAKGSPGYFDGRSIGKILLTTGVLMKVNGDIVSKQREVEFFFYPKNRGAKVKLSSAKNRVTVVASSKNVDVTVSRLDSDCLEISR